jgi:hypothetical protein
MKRLKDDKELQQRIAQLPREISPEHDVWERISARISEPAEQPLASTSRSRWPLRVAAAVVVGLAAGLILNRGWQQPAGQDQLIAASGEEVQPETVITGPEQSAVFAGLIAGSDAEYQAAFREFLSISPERNDLSGPVVEKIETGWAEMMRTEAELAGALEANPNDEFLNGRMLELRSRQLGFLKQLAALDRNNRRLTI